MHPFQTGKIMMGLEETIETLKPDLFMAPGDTNSTLAGALAAKLNMPMAYRANTLVKSEEDSMIQNAKQFLSARNLKKMRNLPNPFGKWKESAKIINIVKKRFVEGHDTTSSLSVLFF